MVDGDTFGGEAAYRCEICGFHYETEGDAEACEEGCRGGVCDDEVTAGALERRG